MLASLRVKSFHILIFKFLRDLLECFLTVKNTCNLRPAVLSVYLCGVTHIIVVNGRLIISNGYVYSIGVVIIKFFINHLLFSLVKTVLSQRVIGLCSDKELGVLVNIDDG